MSREKAGRGRPGTVNIAKATARYIETAGPRPYDGPPAAAWDNGLMQACPRVRQVVNEGVCMIDTTGKVVPKRQGRM